MKLSFTHFIAPLIALTLIVSPSLVFAKSNPHNTPPGQAKKEVRVEAQFESKVQVKKEASSKNNVTGCVRAFGHLIAPGWLKKNNAPELEEGCALPFGIGAKLGLGGNPKGNDNDHSSSTPPVKPSDTIAPWFFYIHTSSTSTSTVTVNWFTNERSTSQVEYGPTTAYGATTTTNTTLAWSHAVTLTDLIPNTTYHYRVLSKDAAGNQGVSADKTFTTGVAADTTAPVISSLDATSVASTTATVAWTTNEPATSVVYYAASTTLDITTASSTTNAALATNHSLDLSGLTASTAYKYAVKSVDGSGNATTSATASFITSL